jgi:hypothetical protein
MSSIRGMLIGRAEFDVINVMGGRYVVDGQTNKWVRFFSAEGETLSAVSILDGPSSFSVFSLCVTRVNIVVITVHKGQLDFLGRQPTPDKNKIKFLPGKNKNLFLGRPFSYFFLKKFPMFDG